MGTVYDPGAVGAGGCTVITTDRAGRNLGEFVALSGTVSNCAGGPTPWRTWLTCEETEDRAGDQWAEGGRTGVLQKNHGYVFEVWADGTADPRPITCLGRYAHEALAIDQDRTHIYLSEDADEPNGRFYRWTAPRGVRIGPGVLTRLAPNAGVLSAMQIIMDDGSVLPDVAYLTSAQLGRPFPVRWIEVPERDAKTTPVREQFADGQITRGRKFEGVWGTDEGVYVVNSYAWEDGDLPGDAAPHDGMVWFYNYGNQTMQLVTYFPTPNHGGAGCAGEVHRPDLRRPGQCDRHSMGKPRARRGRRRRLPRAQCIPGWPDVRHRPQPAQRLRVLRANLHPRRQGPLRQHAGPRPHPGHHRPWQRYLG
jgi:hypothetical protein